MHTDPLISNATQRLKLPFSSQVGLRVGLDDGALVGSGIANVGDEVGGRVMGGFVAARTVLDPGGSCRAAVQDTLR